MKRVVIIFYDENYRYVSSKKMRITQAMYDSSEFKTNLNNNMNEYVASSDNKSIGYKVLTDEELEYIGIKDFNHIIYGPDQISSVPLIIFGINRLEFPLSKKDPDKYNIVTCSLFPDLLSNTEEETQKLSDIKDVEIQINDSKIITMQIVLEKEKNNNVVQDIFRIEKEGNFKIELYDKRVSALTSIHHITAYYPEIDPVDELLFNQQRAFETYGESDPMILNDSAN